MDDHIDVEYLGEEVPVAFDTLQALKKFSSVHILSIVPSL